MNDRDTIMIVGPSPATASEVEAAVSSRAIGQ